MAISDEDKKATGDKVNKGYGILSIIFGAVMVWQGTKYMDDCPNGAADFLYVGGIVVLLVNGLAVLADFASYMAMRDGRISGKEQCCLCLIAMLRGLMAAVNLIITIWGSVVVFGAYRFWSYDEADAGKAHYCPYSPMIIAFVILIINWIMIPLMLACACLAGLCAACTKAVFSSA